MRDRDLGKRLSVGRRLAFLMVLPVALILVSVLGCSLLVDPRYAERAMETATVVSAQSTAFAQSMRATATAVAPVVQVTATAVAERTLSETDPALAPLAEQFGLLFVHVAGGEFTMGQAEGVAGQAAKAVTLDAYWIGLTEVTNAQYRLFVEAGGYEDESLWTEEGWTWRSKQYGGQPGCWSDPVYSMPEQPVACVSWHESMAYGAWLSRETQLAVRLPTEEEWEKAARGADMRTYPWGGEAVDGSRANYGAGLGAPAPVGMRPEGASPYGALDMAGNVAEWSSTPSGFDEQMVVRGGSWFDLASSLGSSLRTFYAPDRQSNYVGLRVVVTFE